METVILNWEIMLKSTSLIQKDNLSKTGKAVHESRKEIVSLTGIAFKTCGFKNVKTPNDGINSSRHAKPE